jgi:hypothetical protein
MSKPWTTVLTRSLVKYTPDEEKISAASRTIGAAIIGVAVFAVVALWIWARGVKGMAGGNPTIEAMMGANLLVGLAAAAAGAVFGFIFGMPRTMTLAERLAFAKAVKEGDLSDNNQAIMGVNTNLERVSDWLTTLLVGATLVQIRPIAEWIGELGSKLLKPGAGTFNDAIVPVIIVLFFCLSFLGIYLMTRLYLTSALSLTGGIGSAERRADSPEELGSKLKKSLESGKIGEIVAALKAVDDAKLTDDVRKNPALNASMARALAKLIGSRAASGRSDPKADLRAAVDNAIADPTVAEELKKDGAKSLATGDAALDTDISTKLNATATSTTSSNSALTTLTKRIDDALKSGTVEDVAAAFSAIGETALPDEAKEDAALNAKIVRLVARMIQLDAAPDRTKAVAVLREAVLRAGKLPLVAEGLHEGFEEGSLTTGNTALDNEIKSNLVPG